MGIIYRHHWSGRRERPAPVAIVLSMTSSVSPRSSGDLGRSCRRRIFQVDREVRAISRSKTVTTPACSTTPYRYRDQRGEYVLGGRPRMSTYGRKSACVIGISQFRQLTKIATSDEQASTSGTEDGADLAQPLKSTRQDGAIPCFAKKRPASALFPSTRLKRRA